MSKREVPFTNMNVQINVGTNKLHMPYAVCDICGSSFVGNQDEDLVKHTAFHREMWDELAAAKKTIAVRKRGTRPS